jgi:hypothetical protein
MKGLEVEKDCPTHGNDMIADLHIGDALTNALDYTTSLVTEDDRESAFGILARKRIRILMSGRGQVRQDFREASIAEANRTVWQRPE